MPDEFDFRTPYDGCPLCQEGKKGGMNEKLEGLWQLREEKHKCRRGMDGSLKQTYRGFVNGLYDTDE